MKLKHLEEITKAVAQAISDNQEKVWVYIPSVGYILDQEELEKIIHKALEDA